jgi:hypothetical protein
VRYYRITLDEAYDWLASEWGGGPTFWFEINHLGDANRQIARYPNGNTLSYDPTYEDDEYNGLQIMVVDGDEDNWAQYGISKDEFEQEWSHHIAMNRTNEYKYRLASAKLQQLPDILEEPPF